MYRYYSVLVHFQTGEFTKHTYQKLVRNEQGEMSEGLLGEKALPTLANAQSPLGATNPGR